MPTEPKKSAHTLEDYADFLAELSASGMDVLVIGGMAVGAYAALRGETVLSADLDVYTTLETQLQVMDWAPVHGYRVVKRPQPRSISTAFIEWRGKEVNVLTETHGLPPPANALQQARVFRLAKYGNLSVLVVDPYDLLTNKLKVNRPKDQPHQEVLRRFIEAEVVEAFRIQETSRDRIAPAQRYLEVIGERNIPLALALRLLPLAGTASDFRLLIGRAPSEQFELLVLEKVPEGSPLRTELEAIRARRHA